MNPNRDTALEIVAWWFRTYDDAKPSLVKVMWGAYAKYPSPRPIKIPKSKREIAFDYVVIYAESPPIAVGVHHADPAHADDLDGELVIDHSWQPPSDRGAYRHFHLNTRHRLADAVEDNRIELDRSAFPFALSLSRMTRDLRQELYTRNLDEIRETPEGVDAATGVRFLRALAEHATYDPAGAYYPKWRPGKENQPPYESNISDRYFRDSVEELRLVRDNWYVVIQSSFGLVIYQLDVADDGTWFRRHYGGVPERDFVDTEAIAKRGKTPYQMYVIVAAEGLDKPSPTQKRKVKSIDGHTSTIEVIDPQALVIDTVGPAAAALLGINDAFGWFIELVTLRFPNRFYILDLRRRRNSWTIWNAVPLIAARDAVHPLIKQAMSDDKTDAYGGVFTADARKRVEAALKDVNLLVLPQGLKAGNTRLVGCTDLYAYMRSLETGLISILPLDDYVTALAAGQFGEELYQSTKWIIPMAKAVAYLAAAAVGGFAVAEMGLTAAAVRQFAVSRARKHITEKVLWEAVKKFGPAVASLCAEHLLALWGGQPEWQAFAKGFFEGYVVQTLYDNLYKKVVKIVTDGPAEYRMAVTIKKVHHAIDRLHGVFSRFEDEVDYNGQRRAVMQFQEAAQHLVRGVVLLMSATYYVPHADAAPMLDVFGRGGKDVPAPTAEEWEAEASAQIAKVSELMFTAINQVPAIDELIMKLRNSKALMAGATMMVLRKQIASVIGHTWRYHKGKSQKVALKSKRSTAVWVVAISAILLLTSDQGAATGNKAADVLSGVFDKLFVLIKDTVSGFPGRNAQEAELFGKIIGNLLGGFMLDRYLFKDDHKFRKLFDAPIVDGTLKNNLKHGVVKGFLSLIFKRYLSLYNDLVKKGVLSKSRRETEFAALVATARDQELKDRGLEHLAAFSSESEKSMSLQDLAKALLGYHRVVREDGVDLLEQHYRKDIDRVKHDFLATAKLSDDLGITGYAEEHTKALFLTMNAHLTAALHELSETVRYLFTPFTAGGHFSWMVLLKELGFDVGDIAQIQNEVRKMFGDQLGDFKAATD